MGKIYSVGMAKNSFDVAPWHSRITVYSKKPKDSCYQEIYL